jgi:hypothetical protein
MVTALSAAWMRFPVGRYSGQHRAENARAALLRGAEPLPERPQGELSVRRLSR